MPDTATILLVDPTDTVADQLCSEFEPDSVQFRVESTPAGAKEVMAAADIDCLVVNHDALGETDSEAFVTAANRIAPGIPIVLLTSAERVSEAILEQTTTVVERTDSPDRQFLAGKIRRNLQTTSDGPEGEMYRMLVESARDGLYRLDANGSLVYANESWSEMLGYDREEMLGSHASNAMAEGELERGQALIQQILEDDGRESDIIDLEMVTKDGERITVAVRFVVLTTDDGEYDGVMGVARDVTERRADKQRLEAQNERLDEFASVVSHDLRNPLNVAQGRLELLEAECPSEHIEPIDRSLTRMDDLIGDLLTLAREGKQITERQRVDLGEFPRQCWQNVETGTATLHTRIDRSIQADRNRLQQLFENLMRNAVDHGGEGVALTVGTVADGFYVEDDGPGIPETERADVFESGYSTANDGTGFGLHIVKQIAEAHGWEVRVTDGADGGARFEISGVEFVA